MWMVREMLSKETTLKLSFHVEKELLDNERRGTGLDFVHRCSIMCEHISESRQYRFTSDLKQSSSISTEQTVLNSVIWLLPPLISPGSVT